MATTHEARLTAHPTYETVPGYWKRHEAALTGILPKSKHQRAFALMLRGWLMYADASEEQFELRIGDDGVLGEYWAEIGKALHGLLDGEIGNIDAGAISALLSDILAEQGHPREG